MPWIDIKDRYHPNRVLCRYDPERHALQVWSRPAPGVPKERLIYEVPLPPCKKQEEVADLGNNRIERKTHPASPTPCSLDLPSPGAPGGFFSTE